jgi:hypothetical protein
MLILTGAIFARYCNFVHQRRSKEYGIEISNLPAPNTLLDLLRQPPEAEIILKLTGLIFLFLPAEEKKFVKPGTVKGKSY